MKVYYQSELYMRKRRFRVGDFLQSYRQQLKDGECVIENCDEPISDEEYERDIDICETLRKRISKLERVPANRLIQTTYNYDFFMLDINTNTKELYGPDDFEEKVRPCFVVSDKKLENDYMSLIDFLKEATYIGRFVEVEGEDGKTDTTCFLYKGKYTSLFFDESGLEICYNDEFGDLHYTSGTYSVFNNPREIYKLALRDYKRSNVRLPFDNVLDNIKRDHGDINLKKNPHAAPGGDEEDREK